MAALPYMQFYVADYLADTAHLSAEEHGAYLLLIFNYWQTGKAIPKKRLQMIARVSNDRWADVEQAISEFFTEVDGCWRHDRIEADLAAVRESQDQRARAGKASAEARKRAKQSEKKKEINDASTTVERPLSDRSTNKEQNRTDTDNKTPPSSGDDDPGQVDDSAKSDPVDYKGIINLYNDLLGEFLPEVKVLNEKRKRLIKARWKQKFGEHSHGSDMDFWRRYFLHVRRSKPLTGTKDGFDWSPGFDWLLNENNLAKVIEGNYHQGDDYRNDIREAS
ncbi:hypothetical protein RE428_32170 [Marinobacter nanhaiticus D15-8W]|uniref:DUF1376 domain-containing protein n=1 Tax=Marinobacter nanhaiticus D15-8W TaxID=626887 RepID=N6W9F3_9GAMM|nr:DUF1376 domain-containing protein [Marinobacter nanhaiticus]ENO16909.1 DUF1376 domain-containing protein [Marinobacter nanhaiticus D15-8W]BES72199.1 hypothetical protein RE428_32170 [Marinobacter nanhaiticus D15-8W]